MALSIHLMFLLDYLLLLPLIALPCYTTLNNTIKATDFVVDSESSLDLLMFFRVHSITDLL